MSVGEGTAHYGIGAETARRAADQSSRAELKERLTSDTEPVPCPKCHWINEDLVDAYRQSEFGGCFALALFLGLVGLIFSLACGWFFFNGNPKDRETATFFLIQIPTGILALVLFVWFLQTWRMSRFQPNVTYPDPPDLPWGIPPALLLDQSTGGYILASTVLSPSQEPIAPAKTTRFRFSFGQHQMPSLCCVCLAAADPDCSESYKALEMEVSFPMCRRCRRGLSWRRFGLWLFLVVLTNVALGIVAIAMHWCPAREVWMYSPLTVPTAMILCSIAAVGAIKPARIRRTDAKRGNFHLEFQNPGFASHIFKTRPAQDPNLNVIRSETLVHQKMEATVSGKRVVDVDCEKCGCKYFYEMSREGNAEASMLTRDEASARESAITEARADLNRHLAAATEPVPCPRCHWINERMARDYRSRCYRGCGFVSVCLAGFVSSISLIVGWFIRQGPPGDHGVLPVLFIYCPLTMAGFAAIILMISAALRSQVRPNRKYPQPPDLPREIPPALMIDPVTGNLRRATSVLKEYGRDELSRDPL